MKKKVRRRVYKILIPVVLVGLAIEILIFSPKLIGIEKESAEKSELIKPAETDGEAEQAMVGIELVELRQGNKEWQLWADKAYTLKESGHLILEKVKVRIFGDSEVTYVVTGDKGEVVVDRKDILISGNVVTETSNGYTIQTDHINYKSQDRTLSCDTDIKMLGPSQKGEGPIVLTGTGMLTRIAENEIRILKDVHSEKKLQNGSTFVLQSNNARFKGTDYSAFFDENVIMVMKDSRVTGDRAILDVDPKTKQAYSATVLGKVRLTDTQRWAVAQEAKMIFPEKKFILRGAPRVVQDQDEIRGEEIVFLNDGKEIQVRKAKAKFEKTDGNRMVR